MRSLYDAVLQNSALDPIAASAAQNGATIDSQGYNTMVFTIVNGAATGSPSSYTVDAKVQDGDNSDASDMADVSGATITQITADGKIAVIRVEGLGTDRKRYLRIVVTPAMTAGSSPKALVSAVASLGRAFQNAVGNTT